MDELYRIVNFKKYCDICKHKELVETEDPCNDCLDHPTNLYSEKPINFEEKEGRRTL